MKKNIVIGVFLGIILAIISYVFLATAQKTNYGVDYYSKVDFDFIIPSPWFDQISEIKRKDFVDDVTPYYLTDRTVSSKKSTAEIYVYLVDENVNLGITPFSEKFLIEGETLKKNGIVIDESVKNFLGVAVGEKVSVQLGSKSFDFTVNGVVQSNKFASKLSSIIYFSNEVKSAYEKTVKHTVYSAAFVNASNSIEAEHYFNTEYRAMGKAGERAWYKDDDTYNFARNSALETPVGKEITNIAQIKANATSNTDTAEKLNAKNLLFAAVSVFAVNLITWIIVIFVQRKGIKELRLGKKGEQSSKIINEFRVGEIITFVVFLISVLILKNIANYVQIAVLIFFEVFSLLLIFAVTKRLVEQKQHKSVQR